MDFRTQLQFEEAFSEFNRWYCSKDCGREVTDEESLLRYYIKNGGAADFARRYDQATGGLNRWYCSEFYGREIRDPQILWKYYVAQTSSTAVRTEVFGAVG